jgi:hypothetical protein
MSSLRPAKIATTLFHLIGGSLADPVEPYGPTCSCEACMQAWRRNQSPESVPVRARIGSGQRRVGAG